MKHSLLSAYANLHRANKFPGYSIEPYIARIADLVRESRAQTLLDYGCGAGRQYSEKRWHEEWGIMPALYDPAVPEFSVPPTWQYDGVICTDVLEHVPESELDEAIEDLVSYSRLWCFISVCCRPAKSNKKMPGGINAHVTLRSEEWWRAVLAQAFYGKADLYLEYTP